VSDFSPSILDSIPLSNKFQLLSNIEPSTENGNTIIETNISSHRGLKKQHKNNNDEYSLPGPFNNKGFSIAHLNVRSLLPKIEEIKLMVKKSNFGVFAVSETWLTDSVPDEFVNIDGYRIYRNDRETCGGGVAIYVKEDIQHSFLSNLISSDIENSWVLIKPDHYKPFLIGCFYRPPSSNKQYLDKMIECIQNAKNELEDLIVLGDFNFPFSLEELNITDPCVYLQHMVGARQLITCPTRVTRLTSTIIDHIYTTIPEKHSKSGVMECSISDHYLIYTLLSTKQEKTKSKEIRIRNFNKFNNINFISDIRKLSLLNINNYTDVNKAWDDWSSKFSDVCAKHAPLRTVRVKDRRNPWVTQEILQLMYQRDKIHAKAKKTSDIKLWNEYKYYRNLVVTELRHSECNYFSNEIDKHRGKPSMWKPLKMALNKNSKSNCIPPNLTPNKLNEYYVQVGPSLADKFNGEGDLSHLESHSSSFVFSEISIDTVYRKLLKLKLISKLDVLDFDSKLLRIAAPYIAPQLSHIFNLSMKQSTLPKSWKTARVIPIYKGKGENDSCINYRPISTLPFVAKIIESCVHEQLIDYLDKNKILCCEQSAYLKHHSTNTSLHKVVDDWLCNINNGMVNGVAFFDLSKCFDTINHKRLLNKLKLYGIREQTLKWFENYLRDRSQAVFTNGTLSDFLNILMGVPQGSNLGPLLFLLFVNDFAKCLDCTTCNLFADDTAIYCGDNSISNVNQTLQIDVENAIKWFKDNLLTVNIDKSCAILIGTNQRLQKQNLSISVENMSLSNVDSIKYLGVTIDQNLSWNTHISAICKKVSPKIEMLRKLKCKLPRDQICIIYESIIQPHFDYCISVWGHTSKNNITLLQRLQNRAARVITGVYDWNYSASKLVKSLGWMTIEERVKYFTLLLAYKSINGKAPSYLCDKFKLYESSYCTRATDGFKLTEPKPNLDIFKRSFIYSSTKLWNNLPQDLKESPSINSFKYNCKKYVKQRVNTHEN